VIIPVADLPIVALVPMRLLPMRLLPSLHWVFIEPLELRVIVLGHVEEDPEGLDASAFLFEELDDCCAFMLVCGTGAGRKGRGCGKVDV
jgi:hypothetical protein